MKKVLLFESRQAMERVISLNEKRLIKANGKSICIVLKEAGLTAFENACPHLGHPLHEGHLNSFNEVICPLHSYRFNLNTGHECENRSIDLKFIEVIEEGDKLFLVI